MFWKKIFLNRMMEFQVKFCHYSGLRLWRTGILFSTKSKCHNSKFHISWMCRSCFYDLKVHFWWPNKSLFWCKSSLNTLYTYNPLMMSQKDAPKKHPPPGCFLEGWKFLFKLLGTSCLISSCSNRRKCFLENHHRGMMPGNSNQLYATFLRSIHGCFLLWHH